jgi:hypothetical protein
MSEIEEAAQAYADTYPEEERAEVYRIYLMGAAYALSKAAMRVNTAMGRGGNLVLGLLEDNPHAR